MFLVRSSTSSDYPTLRRYQYLDNSRNKSYCFPVDHDCDLFARVTEPGGGGGAGESEGDRVRIICTERILSMLSLSRMTFFSIIPCFLIAENRLSIDFMSSRERDLFTVNNVVFSDYKILQLRNCQYPPKLLK